MTANPEMLIIARQVRSLTQQQLSEQTTIEWGKLSRYENGLLPVPQDDLATIAKTLDFPIYFFHQQGMRSTVKHYCKHGIVYR